MSLNSRATGADNNHRIRQMLTHGKIGRADLAEAAHGAANTAQ